jgi:TonB family protein
MNWLHYLAEANIYLGVFYLAYCLFLNRNTHYQLSRTYLIFSCIAAFILPVLQLGALRPVKPVGQVSAARLMTPVIPPQVSVTEPYQPPMVQTSATPSNLVPAGFEPHFTLQDGLWYVYLLGAVVLLIMLFIKLYTLFRLTRNEQIVNESKYRVIYLNGTDVAFSFFNYLFIGADAPGADIIIRHELVHIRQKHSADIILLELLKIINWFNPLVYLLQNSLKTVHEYIADEQTAACETDALTYASFLVRNAYGDGGTSITHSFFNHNLLKKRIIMLNQQRSGNLARLKYLVAIPICAALLCASTLVFSKTYGWIDLVKNQHIKAGAVEDSARFTTKDGRLILPVINVDGYYPLDHFLHKNIHYSSAKGEKGGLVEVGFTLDNDRHITNVKIVKSGGQKLDALALNGFNAYKGVVNDDAGKNYVLGVYFFTDDYSIFKTDSMQKVPNFAGELIITNYKYSTARTSKGYEYDESGTGFPGDNTNMSQAKVVIYNKNGEGTWYFQKNCSPADLKMLQDKYGYAFPSASSLIIQFMHPKNILKSHLAYLFDVNSYLSSPYANQFYNYMLDNTEYPEQAKKALAGGVVVLNFNLDNAGMIGDVNVAQSGGSSFDEAAVKALRSYRSPIKDSAGKHSIAVLFCVVENKYRPHVNEKIKTKGYAGELAVCDAKSPFVNGSAKYTPPATAPGSQKN